MINSVSPFLKTVEKCGKAEILRKKDPVTKALISELVKNADGTYVYKKFGTRATILEKTVYDGKSRKEYVRIPTANGKGKLILKRELTRLNSFIEWFDAFYNQTGDMVKQVLKLKGVNKTIVKTDIPKKPAQRMSK